MAFLFPPYVEGKVPAFYEENGAILVTVPCTLNKAVGETSFSGYKLKLKTIQSSNPLGGIIDSEGKQPVFNLDGLKSLLNIGQSYKLQIAYTDLDGNVGYYSTVATGKYTTKPIVTIAGLTEVQENNHIIDYYGSYSQEGGDVTEKVYNYRFKVFKDGEIIEDTGWLLHNSSEDIENYKSQDQFTYNKDLNDDSKYQIQYFVVTTGGAEFYSSKYEIKSMTGDIEPEFSIITELNFDNGYISIQLNKKNTITNTANDSTESGDFILCRSDEISNFTDWEEIYRFSITNATLPLLIWKDFTIQHGINYKYSLQQYNSYGVYSKRLISEKIYADFEDLFLWDGQRQLKVRYNPKVSNFKTDILETKVDTIGSKYPFIFRSGQVSYKDFPVSGLISYYMDEEKLFLSEEELERKVQTIDLISENLYQERIFKLSVLDWLNNGKEKLFRSPVEGNYIVRLMNNNLQPVDTTGRMIHNFSAQAYEMYDCTVNNFRLLSFISNDQIASNTNMNNDETPEYITSPEEIDLSEFKYGDSLNGKIIIQKFSLSNLPYGTQVQITSRNGESSTIQIGVTGYYSAGDDLDISEIKILGDTDTQISSGILTINAGYIIEKPINTSNDFSTLIETKNKNIILQQFVGLFNSDDIQIGENFNITHVSISPYDVVYVYSDSDNNFYSSALRTEEYKISSKVYKIKDNDNNEIELILPLINIPTNVYYINSDKGEYAKLYFYDTVHDEIKELDSSNVNNGKISVESIIDEITADSLEKREDNTINGENITNINTGDIPCVIEISYSYQIRKYESNQKVWDEYNKALQENAQSVLEYEDSTVTDLIVKLNKNIPKMSQEETEIEGGDQT